jgi:modulator of FtsH protease
MLAGYESHQWFEFGVAIVGAAAVLSGLLFVAMSINIERIMAIVPLPARAAGTLVLFVIPLMVGTWMLIPEQSTTLLGAELVVTGLLGGIVLLRLPRALPQARHEAACKPDQRPAAGRPRGRGYAPRRRCHALRDGS